MIPRPEHRLARARVLRERGNALPPDGPPSDEIVDSWVRCLDAGLSSHAALQIPVVEDTQLRERRERAEVVRRLARAELETLSQQIAGSNFLLAFADPDGIILDCYADNRFRLSGSGAGIVAGSLWREEIAGTNGLGARHGALPELAPMCAALQAFRAGAAGADDAVLDAWLRYAVATVPHAVAPELAARVRPAAEAVPA